MTDQTPAVPTAGEAADMVALLRAWDAFELGQEAPAPLHMGKTASLIEALSADRERLRAALEDLRDDLESNCKLNKLSHQLYARILDKVREALRSPAASPKEG